MYLKDGLEPVANARLTADGYLVARARVARTGIQEYLGSEVGKDDMPTVRVYRPEAQVFATDSFETYGNLPVTLDHPPELVSADSWKKYAVGHVRQKIIRDGDYVVCDMQVTDAAAIAAVQTGKRQLSMGYQHNLDWTPGTTPDGQAYDAVQTDLRMNHVAIVDQARGGSQLVIDAQQEKPDMGLKTVQVDGIPVETTDAGATVIATLQGKIAAADAALDAKANDLAQALKNLETKDGEIAVLKKQADDAKITPEKLSAMVKDRAAVVDGYRKVMGENAADPEKLDDGDMKKAAVKAHMGDAADTMSADAIQGAFAALTAGIATADNDPLRSAFTAGVQAADSSGNGAWGKSVFDAAGVPMKKEA